jgi:ankyrin repeat protein
MIQFLLDVGADPRANDKWSTSPFWYACDAGRFENAKLLASILPVNELRRHQARVGNTPSHAAAANKHYELSHWINHEIAKRFKKGTK